MKQLRYCLIILVLLSVPAFGQSSEWLSVDDVSMSGQISLKDYKKYLSQIQKDSTAAFYSRQLIDTSIGSAGQMKEYLQKKEYESISVVGVSWESAMNYCYWLTKKEQPDSIRYYYRLPGKREWEKAYQSDSTWFASGFEDWLLNSKDESIEFLEGLEADYIYYHAYDDPSAMRRKLIVGTSLLRTVPADHTLYYYSDHGYKTVGFRLVKVELIAENQRDYDRLLKYWNQ